MYDINDDVLVKGDKDESYACSVKCFYVDESREEMNRAEVCWLFAFKELPKKCRITLKNYSVHKKEVFQPLAESDGSLFESAIEDIDAETIGSLCFVKELGVKENIPTTLDKNEYVMRYGFNKNGELVAITKTDKSMKHDTYAAEEVKKPSQNEMKKEQIRAGI